MHVQSSHAAQAGDEQVDNYLVSPLVQPVQNGWFASSVRIRFLGGSRATERVLRMTRIFRSATQAAVYARAEGLRWIGSSGADARELRQRRASGLPPGRLGTS